MLDELGDLPEVNWLERKKSYTHLTEHDYQDSVVSFNQNVNMSEEEMENIWATQYRCFAETVLAELHHKYDLRLRVTPVQKSTTKVTDKA